MTCNAFSQGVFQSNVFGWLLVSETGRGLQRAKCRVLAPLTVADYGKQGTTRALTLLVSVPHHPQQQTRSPVAVCSSALKTSLDGEPADPLSNDFQYCATLLGKKFLLKYDLNKRFIFPSTKYLKILSENVISALYVCKIFQVLLFWFFLWGILNCSSHTVSSEYMRMGVYECTKE